MTKFQKILVIGTSIGVSIVVGGALYVHFKRKQLKEKLNDGEFLDLKYSGDKTNRRIKLKTDPSNDKKYIYAFNADSNKEIGKYILDGDNLFFEKVGSDSLTKVYNKGEVKLIKYFIKNIK